MTENCGSQEVTEGSSRNCSQELTATASLDPRILQEVTGTGTLDAHATASQEVTHSDVTHNAIQKGILMHPDLAQRDAIQLSEQGVHSSQEVTNSNTPQDDTDSETPDVFNVNKINISQQNQCMIKISTTYTLQILWTGVYQ